MQNLKSILGWNHANDWKVAEARGEKWGPNIEKLPINDKSYWYNGFFNVDIWAMLHTLVMMTSCWNLQNLTILSQMYNTIGLKTHFQACRKLNN